MLSKIYLFSFANKTLQKGTLVNWLSYIAHLINKNHHLNFTIRSENFD